MTRASARSLHPAARPHILLFDWHATLVDTMDAMYLAVEEVIPRLREEGLIEHLVPASQARSVEDARLLQYVRQHERLHPKISSDRRISRTDIFEILFGADEDAKRRAHAIFDRAYGKRFGAVRPMEASITAVLEDFRALGLRTGVLSNRRREYMAHELWAVEDGRWVALFDTMICGDDVARRKPAPDLILKALDSLEAQASPQCWYLGDSTTDIIAAKQAGVTALFYNGAGWDQAWLDKIFPGSARHPHRPDAVVASFTELRALVRQFLSPPARS